MHNVLNSDYAYGAQHGYGPVVPSPDVYVENASQMLSERTPALQPARAYDVTNNTIEQQYAPTAPTQQITLRPFSRGAARRSHVHPLKASLTDGAHPRAASARHVGVPRRRAASARHGGVPRWHVLTPREALLVRA